MLERFTICATAAVVTISWLGSAPARAQQPNEQALRSVQGQYKFGMSVPAVCKRLERRIAARYKDRISATTDPFVQDKLRKKMQQEYARIAASYIRFTGNAKGWDASMISDEFAHKSGESMLYWEDPKNKNNRRFFFFFRGKLYKTLTTLDMTKLPDAQREFAIIQRVLEKRFGKGKVRVTTRDGVKEPAHIDWHLKDLWVRASDKLRFYNTFIISATNLAMWRNVLKARAKNMSPKQRNNILKSIIDKNNQAPGLDEQGNVIKEITGGKNKRN